MLVRLKDRLEHCARAALGFLYPEVCQYCRDNLAEPSEGFICSDCFHNVRFIRPPFCERCGLPFDGAITGPFECANCREMELHFCTGRAAVAAEGMVLDLIHRWKYQRALWLEPFLGNLLIREAAVAIRPGDWDLIVPVPLHPVREREREFNQAEHLARTLGAALRLPVSPRAVKRIAETSTQTQLSRDERSRNMREAFAPGAFSVAKGSRIIVVDDVLTTGATTSACARVLREAGAAEVCVWTLARGLLH